jgi:hypothetical protein
MAYLSFLNRQHVQAWEARVGYLLVMYTYKSDAL